MEVIVICITVIIVFGMISFIANKYIEKLSKDHDRDALLESLQAQVKKITERLSTTEMRNLGR